MRAVPATQPAPPQDGLSAHEAEHAVLGALMSFDDAYSLVQSVGLEGGDFERDEHRAIYTAIRRVKAEHRPVDLLSVFEQLRAVGAEEKAGGLVYLNQLCGAALNARAAASHALIVREAASRRQLSAAGQTLQQVAAGPLRGQALQARIEALAGDLRRYSGPPQSMKAAIALEWAADMPADLQAPQQIVEGVLTAGGMSMFFGESNSGKSYLAIHLAICVTLGAPWLGRRTTRGAVVYVAAEGAWTIRLRLAADAKHHARPIGRFGLIPQALDLTEPSVDIDNLIGLLREQQAALGEPISLIVIDTVARVMGGGDENAAQDMGRLVSAGDRIRQETGAHLLYIHHAGKDASKGARGHSSLRAALDTEVVVSADESTKTHTAKITKQRDLASKGDYLSARFVSVELGADQWGAPITACGVEYIEAAAGAHAPPVRITSPTAQAVLAYLAAKDAGIRKSALVSALGTQGLARPSVYRAINMLLAAGLVSDSMGLIYRPKEAP